MNSFAFVDKDPRFTRVKSGLALRLHGKGLFYIRAMRNCKKIPSQETGLGNRGFLEALNDSKLILDD